MRIMEGMTAIPTPWAFALKALADAKASDALLARAVREAAGVGALPPVAPSKPEAPLPTSRTEEPPPHNSAHNPPLPPLDEASDWKVVNWTKPGGARSSVRLSAKQWSAACALAEANGQRPKDWLQSTASRLHAEGARVGPSLVELLAASVKQ